MSLTAETTTGVAPVKPPLPAFAPAQNNTKSTENRDGSKAQGQKKVSIEEARKTVESINEQLKSIHTELSFSVDKETDKVVLKIVNSRTHEVIRQIPAEDALRISSHISRLLGLLFDESA